MSYVPKTDEARPRKYSAVTNQMNNQYSNTAYKPYKKEINRKTLFSVTLTGITLDELNDLFDKIDRADAQIEVTTNETSLNDPAPAGSGDTTSY
jgi:hypothetical protein